MKITIKKIIAYLFLIVVLLYIITGFGITRYQLVERLTLGILTKAISFKIHDNLIYLLIILLLSHLYFSCSLLKYFRKTENEESKKV